MDDDLDDLLLQVAGHSESAARPRAKSAGKKRGRPAVSDSDNDAGDEGQPEDSGEGDEEEEGAYQPPARKAARAPLKRRSVVKKPAEDEIEGSDDDDDGYGSDLMGDDEDRARMAAMTEMEREMELFERSEARDRRREARRNARLLKQPLHKEQAGEAMRSSTRVKAPDTAKKTALAELAAKKARADKARSKKRQQRAGEDAWSDEEEAQLSESDSEPDAGRRGAAAADAEPLEDDERGDDRRDGYEHERERRYERDYDEDEEDARLIGVDEPEEAAYEDVLKMQVRRFSLEKWLNEPFFEDAVVGAVARVSIRGSYMMAEIQRVIEREPGVYKDRDLGPAITSPYVLGDERAPGPHVRTSKWLEMAAGHQRKLVPIRQVSNHTIEAKHFMAWHQRCEKDERPQITLADVDAAAKRLKAAENYTYTSADVQRMVAEKRARGGGGRNRAAEKARLLRVREHARDTGNAEALAEVEETLAALEEELARQSAGGARGAAYAHINKRNAAANFDNAFRNIGARPGGQAGAKVGTTGVDVFQRRKTRNVNYWSVGGKKGDAADAGAPPGPTIATGAPGAGARADGPDTPATAAASAVENAATGELELNIDLSVLALAARRHSLPQRLLGKAWREGLRNGAAGAVSKRALTLADYKRRQGIV
ncbi:hypothetical protein WJX81_002907 [Elliptochloris bilobata]|uniref:Plus3 domain-containing protein n=1 Tax=Elliptochloris bilobata TaxID=381761 RepID=A0AAW1QK35_9CHLO